MKEKLLYEKWIDNVVDPELVKELNEIADDEKAIIELFHSDLQFGTAGLRGIIGVGSSRMNIHTVAWATQGFANYLVENFENPSVAIGRDSRNKGEEFVKITASVFAANGVKAYVYPRIVPTPAVSFAIRYLGCSGGVNMTASHNPAAYNGYKAYGADGCQIVTEAADAISASIEKIDIFTDVKMCDFDDALQSGKIAWIEEDVLDNFIEAVYATHVLDNDDEKDLNIVYTPLNGTGKECVSRILEKIGVKNISIVPEQENPDGNFPTCPYPNPEMREALQYAIDLAEKTNPDLILATDPDADRVGTGVKHKGDYVLLTGNEMGVLLLDFLAQRAVDKGEDIASKIAVTTIVSSVMVDSIARHYGFEIRRVLTGFKYIGEIIGELEKDNEEDRYLFGFEESYGYLSGTHVRDKDAINASMLICEMAQFYKDKGMNLAEAIESLYQQHGFYKNKTLALDFPGVEGHEKMKNIISDLRQNPPQEIGGLKVEKVLDYATGINQLPRAEVIELDLENDNKVIVRPSGTEPKIKAYLFAQGASESGALDLMKLLEKDALELLQ